MDGSIATIRSIGRIGILGRFQGVQCSMSLQMGWLDATRVYLQMSRSQGSNPREVARPRSTRVGGIPLRDTHYHHRRSSFLSLTWRERSLAQHEADLTWVWGTSIQLGQQDRSRTDVEDRTDGCTHHSRHGTVLGKVRNKKDGNWLAGEHRYGR